MSARALADDAGCRLAWQKRKRPRLRGRKLTRINTFLSTCVRFCSSERSVSEERGLAVSVSTKAECRNSRIQCGPLNGQTSPSRCFD